MIIRSDMMYLSAVHIRQVDSLNAPGSSKSMIPVLNSRIDPSQNRQAVRGGLICKAHRRFYHSTLGSGLIKKQKKIYLAFYVFGSFSKFGDLPTQNSPHGHPAKSERDK